MSWIDARRRRLPVFVDSGSDSADVYRRGWSTDDTRVWRTQSKQNSTEGHRSQDTIVRWSPPSNAVVSGQETSNFCRDHDDYSRREQYPEGRRNAADADQILRADSIEEDDVQSSTSAAGTPTEISPDVDT
jgi:hypothetical protein